MVSFARGQVTVRVSTVVGVIIFLIGPVRVGEVHPIIRRLSFVRAITSRAVVERVFNVRSITMVARLPNFLISTRFKSVVTMTRGFVTSIVLRVNYVVGGRIGRVAIKELLGRVSRLLSHGHLCQGVKSNWFNFVQFSFYMNFLLTLMGFHRQLRRVDQAYRYRRLLYFVVRGVSKVFFLKVGSSPTSAFTMVVFL